MAPDGGSSSCSQQTLAEKHYNRQAKHQNITWSRTANMSVTAYYIYDPGILTSSANSEFLGTYRDAIYEGNNKHASQI